MICRPGISSPRTCRQYEPRRLERSYIGFSRCPVATSSSTSFPSGGGCSASPHPRMTVMTSDDSDRLFEVGPGEGGDPFEENGLRQRSDFQSRAPRAGADFKLMAIRRVTDAGATVERIDFEIDDIPVAAEVRGPNGPAFLILARGTPDEHSQSGVRRTDTLEKVGFRAIQLALPGPTNHPDHARPARTECRKLAATSRSSTATPGTS